VKDIESVLKDIGEFFEVVGKGIGTFFKWAYKYIEPIILGILFINIFLFFFAVPHWGWILGILNLIVFGTTLVKSLNTRE